MDRPSFPGACRRLLSSLAFAAACTGVASAGTPGLNGPQAIGAFLNGKMPATEPNGASEWVVTETYTGININLPTHITPYPGTNKLLCVAKEGRILTFEDNAGVAAMDTFLDLRNQTFTTSDCGMTWLVFHPQFGQAGSPNRGYVYVTYKWKPAGGNGDEAYWRLSRFTVPDGTFAADPNSEQILVQQYDRQEYHDSGCMMFGPDGYLYYAIGDEGGANDEFHDGQKINDRLFSGIMRIDVDRDLTRSHAIRRQPGTLPLPSGWPASYTANYTIPNDNPFVNSSGANLEEFYALGVRQPYRFSYDTVSNRMWLAESGQDAQEELDLITPGANYGWPFREGAIAGPQAQPATLVGTLKEPIWSIQHGPDGCVVGGYVYRGTSFPELVGRYITVDNVSGRIRAFNYDGTKATDEILTSMPSGSVYSGTSTIGKDNAGDPIFIKINGTGARGRFFKLAKAPVRNITAAWFRFDDQAATNTSGYVSENVSPATGSEYGTDLSLSVTKDNGGSANVYYTAGSGLKPSSAAANAHGVRVIGADGNGTSGPGNYRGDLYTSARLGRLDNFTMEISFKPGANSLGAGYQCFFGQDGTTGEAPLDGEAGTPLQPVRLMRWGRNDATATAVPLQDGDLFFNVRTYNTATSAWTSVPIKLIGRTQFVTGKWYHLAIVGDVTSGTITAYSYNGTGYTQIGQGSGYIGNIAPGYWTVGRGCYNGGPTDWVNDAEFDEVRILDKALMPAQFLYGSGAYTYQRVVIDPPALLSQTGAFSNLATLTPATGVIPYNVNAPLWSDGAVKYRWMAVPNDGTHNTSAEKIQFRPDAPWTFPAGTVFIKHFELPTDAAHPEVTKRLETRFVMMSSSGEPYGITYKWRADGSDADLLTAGVEENVTVADATGATHSQKWTYPGRADCRICHNGNAAYVLGVKTHQLNGDYTYPSTGRTANQLETMAALGWFDSGYHAEQMPYFLKSHNLADTTASLEERVRAYIDSNCSQCHRPGGVRALFDARITTPISDQGLIRGTLESSYFSPDDRLIVPGDLDHSILRYRHGSLGDQKMPPLAKNVVDDKAVTLIADWIMSLPQAPTLKLTAPASAHGNFTVDLTFSESVTGLTASALRITGGSATGLTGSGSTYTLSVLPSGYGTVAISLPEAKAVNAAGKGNFASATVSTVVSDGDLVSWLKFDEGSGTQALDSSEGGHQGTLVNMASTSWIAGRYGMGLHFDGSGQRVTMSNIATSDFTISFWMRSSSAFPVTDAASSGSAIVHADTPGASNDFLIGGTRTGTLDRITFQTGRANGSGNTVLSGTTDVTTGDWVHVAVTRAKASGEMKLYVNGVLQGTATGGSDLLSSNPTISLGGNPQSAANSYTGDLDQFRIHDRVLSAAEIQAFAAETDGPGAYDQWLAATLPGLTHLQDPASDPDGDGISNFGEFAFGNNPLTADLVVTTLTRGADGSATLSYPQLITPGGTQYVVQTSPDLVTWQSAAPGLTQVSTSPIGTTGYQTVTVKYTPSTPGSGLLFFRIQASSSP